MMILKNLKEYENMVVGLSRIKEFLESVGNPQKKLKVVHVAGTNGKGSTAAFISEILKAGGYKTALYTSPHLFQVTERIRINGESISSEIFELLSKKYLKKALEFRVSYFEYLTAIAFIYFFERKVDISVIETGLGGRFDATNVVEKPLVCVITSIAMEHQEILGNTIEKIAFEKAGIIKEKACVVCGKILPKALSVIKARVNPYVYGTDFKSMCTRSDVILHTQKFNYTAKKIKLRDVEIPLLGKHQSINASVAISVARILKSRGYCLNEFHIRAGLKNVICQGRFDIREVNVKNKKFKLIIDGAHNVQGLSVFLKTFRQLGFADEKKKFIFAVMKEKKYSFMIKKVAPFANMVILPHIGNNRAVVPKILKQEFLKYIDQSKIYIVDSVKNACAMIANSEIAISVGSLYLAGEILNYINNKNK
jgi:dihydrofolate synthase/folylpolyglutamate synthase